jgi:hypothetical protein
MKKLSVLFVTFAVLSFAGATAMAQTADEIIKKHLDAIGGVENWKKVKSMKMVASSNANGTEIPINLWMMNNKGLKVEFTVNGMTGYQIITDKAGWAFNPFMGQTKPDAMTADDVKEAQPQLDIQGALVDYKSKGNKVAYLGKDDVEGTECHKLKLTYPSGKEETEYIDAKTFYLIKKTEKAEVNGKTQEVVETFSNFKKLPEGIVVPMALESAMGPLTVKEIEINKGVDESMFVPKG